MKEPTLTPNLDRAQLDLVLEALQELGHELSLRAESVRELIRPDIPADVHLIGRVKSLERRAIAASELGSALRLAGESRGVLDCPSPRTATGTRRGA